MPGRGNVITRTLTRSRVQAVFVTVVYLLPHHHPSTMTVSQESAPSSRPSLADPPQQGPGSEATDGCSDHCYIVPRASRDIGPNGFGIVRAQHTSSYRGQSDEGPQTIDHLDTIMSGPDSLYKVHAYHSYLTGHFSRFVRSSGARISRIKVVQRVTSGFFRFHSHHVLLRHSIDLQILRQTWRLLPY